MLWRQQRTVHVNCNQFYRHAGSHFLNIFLHANATYRTGPAKNTPIYHQSNVEDFSLQDNAYTVIEITQHSRTSQGKHHKGKVPD